MKDVLIEESWKRHLAPLFEAPFFQSLRAHVRKEYMHHTVFPQPRDVFRAFNLCPFDEVKVVILGQDPYHNVHQANGLSFSVNNGVPLPPSLKNIFKEIETDMGYTPDQSGDLTRWARQGVLMLNSILTVRAHAPGSHRAIGWEQFTDGVISVLSQKKTPCVYLLWGAYAQSKRPLIREDANCILSSGHPSPFSSHLFFGNHHFSRTNAYLKQHSMTPIDWR